VIKDFPKGRKQHNLSVPPELKDFLLEKKKYTISTLVSPSPQGKLMSYERYRRVLVKFCTEAKVPVIGTHGLRRSTSTVYMNYGATKDDLRILFAHSSPSLTDRYTHGLGANLQKVSNVIRLFSEEKCSTLGTFQK
jgi:integrase